jgi:regulatory protein
MIELVDQVDTELSVDVNIYQVKVRISALNLLTRREHSLKELTTKLQLKYSDSYFGMIEDVLNALKASNLQSDRRFAESFLRSRVCKGQGQYRIEQFGRAISLL